MKPATIEANNYRHFKAEQKNRLQIKCSCGTTHDMPVPRNYKSCSQEFADKIFRNAGWTIGRNRKLDRCPACNVKALEKALKLPRLKAKPAAAVPAPEPVAAAPEPPPPPPPVPTAESLRAAYELENEVILEFLREHMTTNAAGTPTYKKPMTDFTATQFLREAIGPSVTLERLRHLRQETYGRARVKRPQPAPAPQIDTQALVARIAELEQGQRDMLRGFNAVVARLNDLRAGLEKLEEEADRGFRPLPVPARPQPPKEVSAQNVRLLFKGSARVRE